MNRRTFTRELKLKVLESVKETNKIHEIAWKFKLDRKNFRTWLANEIGNLFSKFYSFILTGEGKKNQFCRVRIVMSWKYRRKRPQNNRVSRFLILKWAIGIDQELFLESFKLLVFS